MITTSQHRAVIEALGLTPATLRELADVLEAGHVAISVGQLAQEMIDELPAGHVYATSLRRLIRWAGDEDAETIKADDVRSWARQAGDEARRRDNARHGVGAEEAFIFAARASYGRAVRLGHLDCNPAAGAELPARPASRRTALESWQLKEAHLSLISASRDPDLDDLVWQALRETAARRSGLQRLRTGDLAGNGIRLIEKGKDRWAPASAHLLERLRAHHAHRGRDGDVVFHRRDGGDLTRKWFEGFAARIQRGAGWADELGVSPHWLRHTTLTDVERIAGVRIAATYAGHSDKAFGVTGRYTKGSAEELRLVHHHLFFDDPADAENSQVAPNLFRRVLPVQIHQVGFVAA